MDSAQRTYVKNLNTEKPGWKKIPFQGAFSIAFSKNEAEDPGKPKPFTTIIGIPNLRTNWDINTVALKYDQAAIQLPLNEKEAEESVTVLTATLTVDSQPLAYAKVRFGPRLEQITEEGGLQRLGLENGKQVVLETLAPITVGGGRQLALLLEYSNQSKFAVGTRNLYLYNLELITTFTQSFGK